MTKYWIAVASKEHVQRGVTGGFAQVCHGKKAPLTQIEPHDWIVYYSPVNQFGGKEICRCFTAIGQIVSSEPYLFEMSENFHPWRVDVRFFQSKEAPIGPLIDRLSFILDKKYYGFPFRKGFFSVSCSDFKRIAAEMGIDIDG